MRKLITTVALLLAVPALASAQNANHQYRGQGYFFFGLGTATGGYINPFIEHVGGGGELFVYKGLGMGAEAGYAHWGRGCDQAWIASGDVSYHFRRSTRRGGVDPFVLIGVTGYFPTSQGRGEPAGNFGGGVNLWLAEHAALRLEVRDHVPNYDMTNGNHYISFRIGVTFR